MYGAQKTHHHQNHLISLADLCRPQPAHISSGIAVTPRAPEDKEPLIQTHPFLISHSASQPHSRVRPASDSEAESWKRLKRGAFLQRLGGFHQS